MLLSVINSVIIFDKLTTEITALSLESYYTGTKVIPISNHAIPIPPHFCYINNLYSSTTQQTDTDRQTDKIQLTDTTNTKIRPKAIVPISSKQIIFVIFAGKFCTVAFAPGDEFVPNLVKL